MEELDSKFIEEIANSYLVQKDQRQRAERNVAIADAELDKLAAVQDSSSDMLDALLAQAQEMASSMGLSESDLTSDNIDDGLELTALSDEERDGIAIPYFDMIDTVDIGDSWDSYFENVKSYAESNGLDLSKDPFDSLLTETEKNEIGQRLRDDYLMKTAHCDKYDYIIASFCGVIAGLIDSFFVGMPGESKLGNWTDAQADKYVQSVSQKIWKGDSKRRNEIVELYNSKKISRDKRDRLLKDAGIPYNQNLKEMPDTMQSCIQYLEKKFGVNYDASSAAYIKEDGVLKGMRPINHHLMSLAHSPSPIGLIFSIIDQFTGKATFVDGGKLIRVTPVEKSNEIDRFELRGSTFPAKLICGVVNWLGHLCSDLVGANCTRADLSKRGSGLPVPLMELLQLCTFNVPDGAGNTISISELSVKIFENGYDLRFAAACAIPVVINEFLIRLLWSLKSRFYHKKEWSESIPFGNQPELRRMLLVGHGTLCTIDLADSVLRSQDLITFVMHLNTVAWARLALSGLQEVRALYAENSLDIVALDTDLEREWNRMYNELH